MRVPVGGIATHGFAQPVDRGLHVLVEPIRVSEIEEVVGLVGSRFSGLGEEVGRLAGLRRPTAPELHDTEIVVERRRRLLVEQRLERRVGLVVALQLDQRARGEEPRLSAAARGYRHDLHGRERAGVIGLLGVGVPEREARPIVGRETGERAVQELDLRGGLLGDQPLDVLLERFERRNGIRGGRSRGRGDAARRAAHQLTRRPIVQREQIPQRPALAHLLLNPPRIEPDAPCVEAQVRPGERAGSRR